MPNKIISSSAAETIKMGCGAKMAEAHNRNANCSSRTPAESLDGKHITSCLSGP